MAVKLNRVVIEEILVEIWNEGEFSPIDATRYYFEVLDLKTDTELEGVLLRLFRDWDEVGVMGYVAAESLAHKYGQNPSKLLKEFIEQFISLHGG